MTITDQTNDVVAAVQALVKSDLAPLSNAIDRDGLYPQDFLHTLGAIGGFSKDLDLATQINIIREVGRECGSTSFLVWCQSACVTYLMKSPNASLRKRYLDDIARGTLLSGTGMSNAVKHLAGIENIRLKAQRDGDDYVVTGSLPWVSNIGDGHLAIVAAEVDDGGYIMFAVSCDVPGVTLHDCPEFAALEGTQTLNIRFKDVRITGDDVLAQPDQFKAYVLSIKPAFVLAQVGMALGIIDASLRTIRESNVVTGHVNEFLDDQHDDLAAELVALQTTAAQCASQADHSDVAMLDVLRLRLAATELTLRATNSAVLHAGARGYLMRHPAQRRQREAVFVAIVTPALKHLRKEIHALESKAREAQAA